MERNVTLDFVRGVAILGNPACLISAPSVWPKAAYLNPAWYGDHHAQ